MMGSFTVIVLHALIVQAQAKETAENLKGDKLTDHLHQAMDKLSGNLDNAYSAFEQSSDNAMDKLTDNLADKLFSRGLSLGRVAQPITPQRPFLSSRPYFAAPSVSTQVQAAQDSLKMYGIGSSPLTNLALTAIDTTNRKRFDVSTQAARKSYVASGWDLVDSKTRERFSEVVKQVEAKESLLAGVTAPMNYFDPLGFSTTVSAGKLLFYREVELKHGRVAMLAALGFLVGEQYHPLFGGEIDVPSYVAFQQTPLETFWPAVVTAIAIPEIFSVLKFQDPTPAYGQKPSEYWTIKTDQVPGDLGFDPLGLKPKDPQEFKAMQTKELNNGRLAMIAAAGMIAQEYATGQKLF